MPADRSASIAICLPGIASRLNRAATSAMRPEPLVMTMKFTTSRIANMIRPITYVAAHQEAAERGDHVPGRKRAFIAVRQDQAGDRHVQRQAKQSGEQQQRREGGEIERAVEEQRDHQHQHRRGDRKRQTKVQQDGGQGQYQDGQQGHDAKGEADIAARRVADGL